jgi:hypothetical protein
MFWLKRLVICLLRFFKLKRPREQTVREAEQTTSGARQSEGTERTGEEAPIEERHVKVKGGCTCVCECEGFCPKKNNEDGTTRDEDRVA